MTVVVCVYRLARKTLWALLAALLAFGCSLLVIGSLSRAEGERLHVVRVTDNLVDGATDAHRYINTFYICINQEKLTR